MKKKSFTKKISAIALSVIMMLGLMPLTVFADGTYTFPSLSQSGDNNSTLRYYLTDENAGDFTIDERKNYLYLCLALEEGWYFEKWDTYFRGYEDKWLLPDSEIEGSNPQNDEGYYTFYNKGEEKQPFVNSARADGGKPYLHIAKGTGYYGDHSVTAVLKPIVTVNAEDGVTYILKTNNPTTISENQTAVKYKEDVTITYQVDEKYVFISAATTGTKNTDTSTFGTVKLYGTEKPTSVGIYTRLKRQNVNFDANGGSGTMTAQTFEHSAAQSLTANSFTRTGYTFAGWNTKADGSGTAYADMASATFAPENDGESITLFAQWTLCTNHNWVNGECELCGAVCNNHSYVYSSDGNTITEACANGCTHNETATITKPDTLVYNGAAKEATVSYSDNWKGGELTITYSANGNIKAGDVTASIEKDGAKATVDFAIEKVVITVTVNDVSAKQYETPPEFTYTVSGMLPTDGWITKPVASTQADMQSAGTFEITASGGDAGANYTITYVPGTLTVENHIEHIGGTATCTEQAICTLCNQPYGKLAEHSYGTEWKTDANKHWHECFCGAKADEAAHNGGTATCTEKAVCTDCSAAYGDLAKHNYGTEWKKDASGHWHECSCGEKADVSVHIPGDAATEYAPQTCTECGYEIAPALGHNHTWGNWISNGDGTHNRTCSGDSSHTESENCTGGTATCTEKAICTDCAAAYGDLAKHNYGTEWKTDADKHWHECSCGAKADEATHTGGTATCTEKAICSVCDTAYVNLADHTYKDGKCTVCQAADPNYVPETTSPQTGDNSHLALWIALLFISGGAVITLTVYDRKKREVK